MESAESPIPYVIEFPIPSSGVNGDQLTEELAAAGVDAAVWITEERQIAVGLAEDAGVDDLVSRVVSDHVPAPGDDE